MEYEYRRGAYEKMRRAKLIRAPRWPVGSIHPLVALALRLVIVAVVGLVWIAFWSNRI